MKRYIIISVFLLAVQSIENIHSENIIKPENNSIEYAAALSSEVIKNPSGINVPFYISELTDLAPAVGRGKTIATFREALKKLEQEPEKKSLSAHILKLSIDELQGNFSESKKTFSIIKNWNISGPWKEYGKADIDFAFQPEKVYKIKDMNKMKNNSAGEEGVLFPFNPSHEKDETAYAIASFTCTDSIVLWLISDAEYKLTVNGKEITVKSGGGRSTRVFSLKGAGGYTIQLKIKSGDTNQNPYIRVMITDETFLPARINFSSSMFNYSFKYTDIFPSEKYKSSVTTEASALSEKMKDLIKSGNFHEGYRMGVRIAEEFPSYFSLYRDFIPLLDKMNRDDEFREYITKFRNIFPESDMYNIWLADFYMTRDRDKFIEIMKNIPPGQLPEELALSYIYMLCGNKKYSSVADFYAAYGNNPLFRYIYYEVAKLSGDNNSWRRMLIEGTSGSGDEYYYYNLGLTEMQSGVDPVMYWEKGFWLNGYSPLMRELSDIYENGILSGNEYYKGTYTDFHPEFRWFARVRKITLHVFESGKVIVEGEDLIPPGSKIRHGKDNHDGCELISGEIVTSVPRINGVKILYVLKVKDSLSVPVNFMTLPDGEDRITVKYKSSGNEEFSVVKFSGEYTGEPEEIFSLVKELTLKSENEIISELNYEVICYGSLIPEVFYRGKEVSSTKYSDGLIRFTINDRFSESDKQKVFSKVLKFSSERNFAQWYNNLTFFSDKFTIGENFKFQKTDSLKTTLEVVHLYVMTAILKRGEINFNPDKLENVLFNGKGTVEERTLFARGILLKLGIKSYISFKKDKDEIINKILLYVPENKISGYWLDFYGEGFKENLKSGNNAFVITGDGCITFPVNHERYIR